MRGAEGLDRLPHPKPSPEARSVARNLMVDVVTAEVTEALSAAGVPCRLLKGPSTARWLYGDGERRSYSDTDLLVPPDRIEGAGQVLFEIGFRPDAEGEIPNDLPRHAHSWSRQGGGAVDLHSTLPLVPVSPQLVWTTLSENTESIMVANTSVEVPSTPARAFHVALHAAQHGSSFEQPILDLERALRRVSLPEWEEAERIAHALGAVEALAAGLGLLPEGARLAERLGLPKRASAELKLRSGPSAPPTALGFAWMAGLPGNKERILFLVRKAFPPPDLIRGWFGPAATSYWGLVVGYLWRPLWLTARAPRGLFAWWRASLGGYGASGTNRDGSGARRTKWGNQL